MLPSLASCVPAGEGLDPPDGQIYFPVGVVVDQDSSYLYVVNSDFDLQFNRGTLFSLDLDRVREVSRIPCVADDQCGADQTCDVVQTEQNGRAPSYTCVASSGEYAGLPCGPWGEKTLVDRASTPGRCRAVSLLQPEDGGRTLLRDSVGISAFATNALLVNSGEGQQRLFVPVRGDSTLHYIDLDNGRFRCGQSDGNGRCAPEFRISTAPGWVQELQPLPHENDAEQEVEPLEVGPEPFDLTASEDGRFLFLSHQTGGRASAFINDWVGAPFLVAELTGLPFNPMGIAALPVPALIRESDLPYETGVLLSTRNDARFHLLRFVDDGVVGPQPFAVPTQLQPADESSRPAFRHAGSSLITVNSGGFNSRGVMVDDAERRRAEAGCAAGDLDCLALAARVPLDVYVANRSPSSLLVGTTDWVDARVPMVELPTFHNNVPLTAGPSRVFLGSITNKQGQLERRVFVLCFDSAIIYVYNPATRMIETEFRTGRGPHSLAFDTSRPLLYVGHFTDSFVGVISLDQRYPHTYGTLLSTVGIPTQPRAAK